MMPHRDIELGQHWYRWWWHQAITWTNVKLSSFLSYSAEGNFTRNTHDVSHQFILINYTLKMINISLRGQWVKKHPDGFSTQRDSNVGSTLMVFHHDETSSQQWDRHQHVIWQVMAPGGITEILRYLISSYVFPLLSNHYSDTAMLCPKLHND